MSILTTYDINIMRKNNVELSWVSYQIPVSIQYALFEFKPIEKSRAYDRVKHHFIKFKSKYRQVAYSEIYDVTYCL